jgi:hypothetical protein
MSKLLKKYIYDKQGELSELDTKGHIQAIRHNRKISLHTAYPGDGPLPWSP